MGKRNWSRDFFRLWVALSLFWIMFVCGAAIVDLVRTLRLPPEPPTFALAEQEADKKCGPSRSLEQIECREEVGFALTDQEKAAEETWRDAYERREERLDNLAPDLAVVLGFAVLPPLMLLLPVSSLLGSGAGLLELRTNKRTHDHAHGGLWCGA
jgi:hypothetical protein